MYGGGGGRGGSIDSIVEKNTHSPSLSLSVCIERGGGG